MPHGTSRHGRIAPAVISAKAGIQYAAAHRSITGISGVLDHPLSRMMTAFFDLDPALGMTAHDALASSEHSRKIQTKYEQRQKSCRRE
jgi:hypothetical protein